MTVKMSAAWTGGMRFVHRSHTGHDVVTDAPEESGGSDTAATPMELLLHGLIGCTGVDVSSILLRMKQPLEAMEVEVAAERAEKHPKVYTGIHITYILTGDLDEAKVKRAIQLSESTYCSASAMLGKTATISNEFRILSPHPVTG